MLSRSNMVVGAFLVCAALCLQACYRKAEDRSSRHETASELTVSAAISLKDAFEEIGKQYEATTGTKVLFNFGASGKLQRQIETGAPVDVFASAGEAQMDALAEKDLILKPSRRDFAGNKIVLIVPSESQTALNDFTQLIGSDVSRIAVGNPKTVPAGQYADQIFAQLGIKDKLKPKLIFAEDVRQVLEYVSTGEVDAGVVYSTDAASATGKVRVAAIADSSSHEPIRYPIAIVKDSKKNTAAQGFIDLVEGEAGRSILKKFGFSGVGEH